MSAKPQQKNFCAQFRKKIVTCPLNFLNMLPQNMSKLNMKPHRKNYKFKISNVWLPNIIFKQKFIEAPQRKRFGSGFSTADYQGYAVEIRTLLE